MAKSGYDAVRKGELAPAQRVPDEQGEFYLSDDPDRMEGEEDMEEEEEEEEDDRRDAPLLEEDGEEGELVAMADSPLKKVDTLAEHLAKKQLKRRMKEK